jgi:hypothetical protein
MVKNDFIKKVIEIAVLPAKAAYKYEGCEFCAFHNEEPGICEECEDESEFEPAEDMEDSLNIKEELKEAA